ncbi:F-box domain-containing protein [Apiospora aurea]|uniref:F-box domain-containing protein n=1 Tax=Apiospora aurea TaxID=335848 RepID=A0ABR1Q2R7_9PEZI
MPPQKRKLFSVADTSEDEIAVPTAPKNPKRPRLAPRHDHLSPLSDELLIRILTYLPLPSLLNVAPVSRRFHRLAEDSQLWKRLYYDRFVLPRAMRIPGFRNGSARGGWVDMRSSNSSDNNNGVRVDRPSTSPDWKGQYKLRHNWSKGKAAVEELHVGDHIAAVGIGEEIATTARPMLVKISEGVAITADLSSGLRAWDLRTKELVAQTQFLESESTSPAAPSCLAVDDQDLHSTVLNVAVGFEDGSFGVWKLDIGKHEVIRKYRHEKSTNGELVGIAYSHPYLLTATESVLISLYTFDFTENPRSATIPAQDRPRSTSINIPTEMDSQAEDEACAAGSDPKIPQMANAPAGSLQAPLLLTSLKSHTSRAPLALSLRKTASTTIASIAYTFSTLQGWSLGIQDLHLRASTSKTKTTPDITTTRIAYSPPVRSSPSQQVPSPPSSPAHATTHAYSSHAADDGPTSICYNHPYLLATLPDNTLILHLCTSNATSLSVSPGIRLWGHTSGISDAEITSRGKAVSARSIEVRPNVRAAKAKADAESDESNSNTLATFDEKRNWVGFDDEMVIVLKESSQGRESLMVYDFT